MLKKVKEPQKQRFLIPKMKLNLQKKAMKVALILLTIWQNILITKWLKAKKTFNHDMRRGKAYGE